MNFQAEMNGMPILFSISSIDEEAGTVTCDANHPMAGKTLTFDVEIISVRDASEEEIAHKHVHGDGGYDH